MHQLYSYMLQSIIPHAIGQYSDGLINCLATGEDRSRSTVGTIGRATPISVALDHDVIEEAGDDGDDDGDRKSSGQGVAKRPSLFVPAADMSPDTDEIRQELYQRYLEKPDTWAKGLKKYLVRTVIRERVTSSTQFPHNAPVGFRPKSISASQLNLFYPQTEQRGSTSAWGSGKPAGRVRMNSASTTIPDHRTNNMAGPKAKTRRRAATAGGKLVTYDC